MDGKYGFESPLKEVTDCECGEGSLFWVEIPLGDDDKPLTTHQTGEESSEEGALKVFRRVLLVVNVCGWALYHSVTDSLIHFVCGWSIECVNEVSHWSTSV